MDVTIVIVSWNTCGILRDCLRSTFEQTGGLACEVIVVDNASADDSVQMVKREFPDVRVIENAENRGFAGANNQGMVIAQGRYVLLLNSNTIVLEGALAKTLAFADAHREAAVVGCRVLNADRTLQASCFMFPSVLNMVLAAAYLYKFFPKSRFFGRERMTWWDKNDARAVDVISGCFMLVRQEAMKQVGLMDDSFFMYAEETDWCYRFKQAGWKNLYTPDGSIIHLGGQSTALVSAPMTAQLRLSILKFVGKHRSLPAYWMSCIAIALFFLVRIPVWLMIWVLRPGKRDASRAKLYAYTTALGRVLLALTQVPRSTSPAVVEGPAEQGATEGNR